MPYRYKQPGNWKTTRRRILTRDGHVCSCGAPATQVDHVVAVAHGGTHHDDNLRAICGACHDAKTRREQAAGKARRTGKRPAAMNPGLIYSESPQP